MGDIITNWHGVYDIFFTDNSDAPVPKHVYEIYKGSELLYEDCRKGVYELDPTNTYLSVVSLNPWETTTIEADEIPETIPYDIQEGDHTKELAIPVKYLKDSKQQITAVNALPNNISIPAYGFQNSPITIFKTNNAMDTIEEHAFDGTKLNSLSFLGTAPKIIKSQAFANCPNIKTLTVNTVPSGAQYSNDWLQNTPITDFTLTSINDADVLNVHFFDYVTTITKMSVPANYFNQYNIANNPVTELSITSTGLKSYAFSDNKYPSIKTFNLLEIPPHGFENGTYVPFTNLNIPIYEYAFSNATFNNSSINKQPGVMIKPHAFENVKNLTDIYIRDCLKSGDSTPTGWGTGAPAGIKVHYSESFYVSGTWYAHNGGYVHISGDAYPGTRSGSVTVSFRHAFIVTRTYTRSGYWSLGPNETSATVSGFDLITGYYYTGISMSGDTAKTISETYELNTL